MWPCRPAAGEPPKRLAGLEQGAAEPGREQGSQPADQSAGVVDLRREHQRVEAVAGSLHLHGRGLVQRFAPAPGASACPKSEQQVPIRSLRPRRSLGPVGMTKFSGGSKRPTLKLGGRRIAFRPEEVMGLRPTQGDEKRFCPATALPGNVAFPLSSRAKPKRSGGTCGCLSQSEASAAVIFVDAR